MRTMRVFFGVGSFSLCLCAQNAGLSGTVTDPGKAVVPGASVTAIKIDTGAEQRTVTNGSGIYLLPELPLGQYEIRVQKEGFQTSVQHAIDLHVNARVQLDFELKVGSTTQTVVINVV